jgi:hypothetical protein
MRPVRDDPLSHRAGCTRLCGDDELYRAVLATLSQREHRAAKAEHTRKRRESASPWGKVGILVTHRGRAGTLG